MSRQPLACELVGTGRPLVLLHPIATSRALFRPLLPILSRQFALYLIDLPGHGDSAPLPDPEAPLSHWAQALLATLDTLQLPTVTLAGVSLGGMVAQAAALAAPKRIKALVLAHTSARTPPASRDAWEQRLHAAETAGMDAQVDQTLARWFTAPFRASAPLTLDWVASMIRQTSTVGFHGAVRAIQQLDYLEGLRALEMPALVLAGDCDAAVPLEQSRVIAEQLPHGQLQVMSGAPHLSNVEQPLAFLEHVGRFVREVGG